MSMSTRKHHDKSSKSSKKDERRHKNEKNTKKKSESKHSTATTLNLNEGLDAKLDRLLSLGKDLSSLEVDLKKHFSSIDITKQTQEVLELEKQLNVKFNSNYAGISLYVKKLLLEKELSADIKAKLQQLLTTIKSLIEVDKLACRSKDLSSKLELLMTYQQAATQHQVEIAAISDVYSGKQKYVDLNTTHITCISSTINIVNDMLDRTTVLLQFINNLNKCLAKPTFQPSAYAAGSPAMHTAKPAQQQATQQPVLSKGITTGLGRRDGKK